MGVTRKFDNLCGSNLEDESDWIYISSDGEETNRNFYGRGMRLGGSRAANRRNQLPKSTRPEPTFSALGVKGKSHKKFRRFANANLLTEFGSSLINDNDLIDDVVSIEDFIPSIPSSFSLLLQDLQREKSSYNDFIECTEERQRDLLGIDDNEDENVFEIELCQEEPELEIEAIELDCHRCFHQIESSIRKQLAKRHLPLGILTLIEQKLVDFFENDPLSVYQTNMQCSYHRFLLHGCCQYLNLHCQSLNIEGKRVSFVKNKRKHFHKPTKLLSEYLTNVIHNNHHI